MRLPSAGEVFQEKYQIHQIIGKGGFATVYRASDLEVGRDVALKILSPRDGDYPEAVVARFMREARLLAGLQDPHTITMFDFGRTDDGLLFMVFEYVSGLDLAEVLKRRVRLPSEEVAHIIKQVLYALREAHEAGVFHRDIKPPNLLIYEYMGDSNCVKLLDFGVAKPVESHPLGPENLTRKGAMVGTPRYMAPEQIYGRELTASADIYSLGLVAFEMLTGRPAMDAKTNKERVRQQLSDESVRVPDGVGSAALRRVINRMIEKDPARRYQSAADALTAMRTGGAEPPEPAPRPTSRAGVEGPSSRSATIDESAPTATSSMGPNVYRVLAIAVGTVAFGVVLLLLLRVPPAQDQPTEPEIVVIGAPSASPAPFVKAPPKAEPPRPAQPDHEASPPVPDPAPPVGDGCGRSAPELGILPNETMIGLRRRSWVTYVPRDYDASKRHPIVLMFHQALGNARGFMEETRMPELADEKQLLLVSIDAENRSASWHDVDNYELVSKVLEMTRARYCVDDTRLYAMGHGRGGWFARDLGCYLPLSAVATTGSGQRVGETPCRPVPPTPTIRFYGTADPFIPVNGGRGCIAGEYMSALEIEGEWIDRYQCNPEKQKWFKAPQGACWTYRGCVDTDARYVSCEMEGGHDWPGSGPTGLTVPNCGSTPTTFPLRDTLWRFFRTEGRKL